MQNIIEIKTVTSAKLIRAENSVVLCGRVIYPCLVGEGQGIVRFNEAYETIAEAFLNQGLIRPGAWAEKEFMEHNERGRYGFARWELLCKMTASFVSFDQAMAACQAPLSAEAKSPRHDRGRRTASKDEAILVVHIETTARRKYGGDIKNPFSCQHFWRFPQGVLLRDKEVYKWLGETQQEILTSEEEA